MQATGWRLGDRTDAPGPGWRRGWWDASGTTWRRAFTVVELLTSIAVIFLLMGLIIVGIRYATRTARVQGDRQTMAALKFAITQFKDDFGILPPLVDDEADPPVLDGVPRVFSFADREDNPDRAFLRGEGVVNIDDDEDRRFSTMSLAYYLVGALPASIDGVDGPGMQSVQRNGSFKRGGQRHEALIELGPALTIVPINLDEGRVELRDRYDTPIRYYRWMSGPGTDSLVDLNVPQVLGSPDFDGSQTSPAEQNTELRSARYAIISAGPNGVFGDFATEGREAVENAVGKFGGNAKREARGDNILEVGS